VDPSREIWFLTICCRQRKTPQLTLPKRSPAIIETVVHRHEKGLWYAHLFLLMPDHAHGLFSFPPDCEDLEKVVKEWKRWTARTLGIKWQSRFFDHRLRKEESFSEKADYILANPMRAGLVARWEDWPHLWMPDDDVFTGLHR
jgi:putative transposase